MTEHIRVLLADHHTLVREGIRQILEDEADIQIIAAAGNGIQAVNLAHEQRPDVASLDIRTPEMTGVEPTRRIKAQVPGVRGGRVPVRVRRRWAEARPALLRR